MARREQAAFTDYEGFVEKFKPKKTTDDCYTPPALYAAVRDWAVAEYGLQGRPLVRPFWPGGDFVVAQGRIVEAAGGTPAPPGEGI